jgi:hypothetical protein
MRLRAATLKLAQRVEWLPLLETVRTLVVTPNEDERVQMQIYSVVYPEGVQQPVAG